MIGRFPLRAATGGPPKPVTVPTPTAWPYPWGLVSNLSGISISSATQGAAVLDRYAVSGDLDAVAIRIGNASASAPIAVALCEQVVNVGGNASPGDELWADVITEPVANTWQLLELTEPVPVVAGDRFALRITGTESGARYLATISPAAPTSAAVSIGNPSTGNWPAAYGGALLPMVAYRVAGVWHAPAGVVPMGEWISSGEPFAYNSPSDERGVRLDIPTRLRAVGVWWEHHNSVATARLPIRLHGPDGELAQAVPDSGAATSNDTPGVRYAYFGAPVVLDAGMTVRLTRLAVPGTDARHRKANLGVVNGSVIRPPWLPGVYTSRHQGGAWTDDPTASVALGLVVDQVG